ATAKERGIVRNPHRLMYASSPDRGLWYLAMVFERIREVVTDAELHVFYGFDNLQKVLDNHPNAKQIGLGDKMTKLRKTLEGPGFVYHGRIGQAQMYDEWLKTGIWCHPSVFPEASCITCMDAQACGAIPVTNPIWACKDNVHYGIF